MVLFTCPNGHRLHSQSLQSGQWIRCPRCGAVAQIPETSTVEPSTAGGSWKPSSSLLSAQDAVDANSASSPSNVPAKTSTIPPSESSEPSDCVDVAASNDTVENVEPTWEFYCPNGHLLRGTLADQGRLAQCPECSSRFRVPEFSHLGTAEFATASDVRGSASSERDSFARLWEFGQSRPLVCELKQGHILVVIGYQNDLSDDVYGVFSGYFRTANMEEIPPIELLAVPWRELSLIRFPSGHPTEGTAPIVD